MGLIDPVGKKYSDGKVRGHFICYIGDRKFAKLYDGVKNVTVRVADLQELGEEEEVLTSLEVSTEPKLEPILESEPESTQKEVTESLKAEVYRTCTKCKKTKLIDDFHQFKNSNYKKVCKTCDQYIKDNKTKYQSKRVYPEGDETMEEAKPKKENTDLAQQLIKTAIELLTTAMQMMEDE